MSSRVQWAVFAVVIVLAGVIGAQIATVYGDGLDDRPAGEPFMSNDGVSDRADATFGAGNWTYVSTGVGGDTCCMQTAVNAETVRERMVRVLYLRGGWMSDHALGQHVAGQYLWEEDLFGLADSPHVERRTIERRFGPDRVEYRYVGPRDGRYEPPLYVSDAELERRIGQQLYVYGGWMPAHTIADNVPAEERRVKATLAGMAERGELKRDKEFMSSTYYGPPSADGHPPRPGMVGLLEPLAVVAIAVVLIGVIRRFQTQGASE